MFSHAEPVRLFKAFRDLFPGNIRFEETPLGKESVTMGWHSVFFWENGVPFSGGTAVTQKMSRRIAIAESFERGIVHKISRQPTLSRELLLDEIPSCSGFAAGFQSRSTHERALFEAVERWAWSKWIDDKYAMHTAQPPPQLGPFEMYLSEPFREKVYLERELMVRAGSYNKRVSFKVYLGLTDEGIFPGSRVSEVTDRSWTHAITEAHRNFHNFGDPALFPLSEKPNDIISHRASYFAKNRKEALAKIDESSEEHWPEVKLSLWKKIETGIDGIFLSRAVCSSHIPWHLGPVNRFVY